MYSEARSAVRATLLFLVRHKLQLSGHAGSSFSIFKYFRFGQEQEYTVNKSAVQNGAGEWVLWAAKPLFISGQPASAAV